MHHADQAEAPCSKSGDSGSDGSFEFLGLAYFTVHEAEATVPVFCNL